MFLFYIKNFKNAIIVFGKIAVLKLNIELMVDTLIFFKLSSIKDDFF